jgi:prevent-host-death family protein
MAEWIGASAAKAHPSGLLARASLSGERFLVERRGKPLAAPVGAEDLKRLERGDSVEAGTRARGR